MTQAQPRSTRTVRDDRLFLVTGATGETGCRTGQPRPASHSYESINT